MGDQDNTSVTGGSLGYYRVRVNLGALVAELELMGQRHTRHKTRYRRYTIRGVPAKRVDVLIAERVMMPDDTVVDAVLETQHGRGAYDGARCRRYLLHQAHKDTYSDPRPFGRIAAEDLPQAEFAISRERSVVAVTIAPAGAPPAIERYEALPADIAEYDPARVMLWHWTRYYRHISYADASAAVASWGAEIRATGDFARWSLHEANRAASQYLYQLSRDLGWSKLTRRVKQRLGLPLESPQWRRRDELAALYVRRWGESATGCGEATLTAAATGHWPQHQITAHSVLYRGDEILHCDGWHGRLVSDAGRQLVVEDDADGRRRTVARADCLWIAPAEVAHDGGAEPHKHP